MGFGGNFKFGALIIILKLGLGSPKITTIILELIHRSVARLRGGRICVSSSRFIHFSCRFLVIDF